MTIERVLEKMGKYITAMEREAVLLQTTVEALKPFDKQVNRMMVDGLSFQQSIEKLICSDQLSRNFAD